jgi:hypothetical protein
MYSVPCAGAERSASPQHNRSGSAVMQATAVEVVHHWWNQQTQQNSADHRGTKAGAAPVQQRYP